MVHKLPRPDDTPLLGKIRKGCRVDGVGCERKAALDWRLALSVPVPVPVPQAQATAFQKGRPLSYLYLRRRRLQGCSASIGRAWLVARVATGVGQCLSQPSPCCTSTTKKSSLHGHHCEYVCHMHLPITKHQLLASSNDYRYSRLGHFPATCTMYLPTSNLHCSYR